MEKYQLPLLMTRHSPIQYYSTVAPALPSKRLSPIYLISNKVEAIPEELKFCAFKIIEQKYIANGSYISILTFHTYQKQTVSVRDGSPSCSKTYWPREKTTGLGCQ
ncbi:hypothetical protein TNCV_2741281 [Trichonephila clavipes]|nr:hypothetical protein TNCV_2741281 [Trichonephila clavipes]